MANGERTSEKAVLESVLVSSVCQNGVTPRGSIAFYLQIGVFSPLAHERGVVDHYAPVHDDGQAVLPGVGRRLLVYDAGLHPQDLRSGRHRVPRRRHDLFAAPEHVDDVHGFGYLFDGRVRFLAKDRPAEVGVDGEDPEPEVLEGSRYRMARPVRPVREPDDGYGARAREQVPYVLRARVLVHRASLLTPSPPDVNRSGRPAARAPAPCPWPRPPRPPRGRRGPRGDGASRGRRRGRRARRAASRGPGSRGAASGGCRAAPRSAKRGPGPL